MKKSRRAGNGNTGELLVGRRESKLFDTNKSVFYLLFFFLDILTLNVGSLSLLDKLDKDGVEVLFFK